MKLPIVPTSKVKLPEDIKKLGKKKPAKENNGPNNQDKG